MPDWSMVKQAPEGLSDVTWVDDAVILLVIHDPEVLLAKVPYGEDHARAVHCERSCLELRRRKDGGHDLFTRAWVKTRELSLLVRGGRFLPC